MIICLTRSTVKNVHISETLLPPLSSLCFFFFHLSLFLHASLPKLAIFQIFFSIFSYLAWYTLTHLQTHTHTYTLVYKNDKTYCMFMFFVGKMFMTGFLCLLFRFICCWWCALVYNNKCSTMSFRWKSNQPNKNDIWKINIKKTRNSQVVTLLFSTHFSRPEWHILQLTSIIYRYQLHRTFLSLLFFDWNS